MNDRKMGDSRKYAELVEQRDALKKVAKEVLFVLEEAGLYPELQEQLQLASCNLPTEAAKKSTKGAKNTKAENKKEEAMTTKQQVLELAKKLQVSVAVQYDQKDARKVRSIRLDVMEGFYRRFKLNRSRSVSIELSDKDSAGIGWIKAWAVLNEGLEPSPPKSRLK